MVNEFSVLPLGGLNVGDKLTNVLESARQRKRQMDWESQAPGVIQSGDPEAIANLMIEYPEMQQSIMGAAGYKRQQSIQDMVDTATKILSGAEDPAQLLGQHIQRTQAAGEDVSKPMMTLGKTLENPQHSRDWAKKIMAVYAPKEFQNLMVASGDGSAMDVAGIKEFAYLTAGLSPEDVKRAKRVKLGLDPRASEDAVTRALNSFSAEKGKLQARLGLEPEVAGAVAAAKNQAKVESDLRVDSRSKQSAWEVYNGAMENLTMAMAGTETGPVSGLIPAVTSNQQIAEGAVAVMAPVLKQMFRSAGEGVFTDKDQELLMKMVPTRRDTPEAIVAKIKGIDAVVRAKLGISGETGVVGEEATLQRMDVDQDYGEDGDIVQPAPLIPGSRPISELSDEELMNMAFGGQ